MAALIVVPRGCSDKEVSTRADLYHFLLALPEVVNVNISRQLVPKG